MTRSRENEICDTLMRIIQSTNYHKFTIYVTSTRRFFLMQRFYYEVNVQVVGRRVKFSFISLQGTSPAVSFSVFQLTHKF